jgi:TP901 family phage tail tape measure protein
VPAGFAVSTAFKAIDKTAKVLKTIQGNAKKTAVAVGGSFKKASATAARSFKIAGKKISGTLSKLERKTAIFGSKFKSAFKTGIAVAGIASITLAMQAGITTGLEFEQTIVNASAKFGQAAAPGTQAFKDLEKAAKDVGATTEFTASQAAGGLDKLALAGFSAKNSIAALPAVVDLATAAQVDLVTASDIATDTLGAMGLATKDATQLTLNLARVNDVFAKATTTANTSIEQLFEAMSEGGPIAARLGVSIEQFAALSGKLADANIKGGRAGTTLKNVFIRLAAPVDKGANALKRLGVSTKDAQGNLRDVTRILDDINKATKTLGTGERAEALNEIFGKIPIAGVNVLLAQGGQALRDYQRQLENAAGSSAEMAAVMRNTTAAAVKTLKSALEGLGLVVFDQIKPAFTDMVKGLTFVIGGWAKFLEMHPGIISILVTIAKIAVPVLAITAAIIGLNVALGIFNFLLVANPIGLIVIAIVAAIALIVVLRKQFIAIGAIIFTALVSPTLLFMKLLGQIPGLGFLNDAANAVFSGAGNLAKNAFTPGGEAEPEGAGGGISTPEVALSKQISETNKTSTSRVILEDSTGRARMADGDGGGMVEIIPRTASFDDSGIAA